jgi:hypothetical protein
VRDSVTRYRGSSYMMLQPDRISPISVALLLYLATSIGHAFAPRSVLTLRRITQPSNPRQASSTDADDGGMFFASASDETLLARPGNATNDDAATADAGQVNNQSSRQSRVLGSQELLMLPRQYGPKRDKVTFPQMNHVSCAILSATPSDTVLQKALDAAMQAHPLLHCRVDGDGEPDKRIDLFQMVRQGEPNPCTFVSEPNLFSALDVLKVIDVPSTDREALDQSWQESFNKNLDDGSWCDAAKGPLWKVELHRTASSSGPCALLFSFNHAISDQSSANRLLDQILRNVAELESLGSTTPAIPQTMPLALEDSVMGVSRRWSDVQMDGVSTDTIWYVASKAAEGLRNPVIVPDSAGRKEGSNPLNALTIISGRAAGGQDNESQSRRSTLQFRSLSRESTSALLAKCRENEVSISNALTAAAALTATDVIDNGKPKRKSRNYKVLQSLDMRRYGAKLDQGESVACMAGSMDLMLGPLADRSGRTLKQTYTPEAATIFWNLARESSKQTIDFMESNGPEQAVRVFDFAMSISDLNNLVHLTAESKDNKGRAYSAGITNVGVYESQEAFARIDQSEPAVLLVEHGKYKIQDIFFATTHTRSGCLYPASCITVDGSLKMTFNPVAPIVSDKTNANFADGFVELLEIVAGVSQGTIKKDEERMGLLASIPENALSAATAVVGLAAVLSHAPAWLDFFSSVNEMKQNIQDPADFWAALNFWIFFAVGHPILQPILWISDVLHASPGPKIGGLIPATFLAGNLAFIALITKSKEIRNAVNIAALAAFLTYVGSGLDGTAGTGDFNLALDDSYKGQIVRGCPSYDEVRQPSMDNFDLEKYQGLWYEQKFHDWTQFKEVYDTTLDIKLTEGGKGWVDDFAVKGPAPDAAKLSWDKSPVANGAHYFLFGRVDPNDPPGILREKGFGVEFPNYIVDVKKDPQTGDYKEAIQFQCLERGGVRVFEGINFMSRNPTMTDEEMTAMHSRAERAGMYPYGASPEQMHTVARRPVNAPEIDNNWQAMWRALGVDKLLELLTQSIEDGGR